MAGYKRTALRRLECSISLYGQRLSGCDYSLFRNCYCVLICVNKATYDLLLYMYLGLCAYIHTLVQIKGNKNVQIWGLYEPRKFQFLTSSTLF